MVDMKLSDLLGGVPMQPIYNVYATHDRTRVVERVAAANANDALAEAKKTLGRDDLMVLHEHADEHMTVDGVVTPPQADDDGVRKES